MAGARPKAGEPAAANEPASGGEGAIRDQGAVVGLEWTGRKDGSLKQRSRIATADEPVALAVTPDGQSLLVASGWGGRLEGFCVGGPAIPSSSLDSSAALARSGCAGRSERLFSAALPREPRAVLVSGDGRTAFLSHMVGSVLSAVDLADPGRRQRSIPMGGSDITPPPPPSYVCLPSGEMRSIRDVPRETKRLAVQGFALTRISSVHPRVDAVGFHVQRYRECLLPRAAAAEPANKLIFVACADLSAVLELDAGAADPARAVRRRYPVAAGPSGIAIDSERGEAYVWSQFARSLSVLTLGEEPGKAGLSRRSPKAPEVRLTQGDDLDGRVAMGRVLFHTSNDKRIARDGRACASCHPDRRDDGLVWPTPDGPRQAPMLAGRLERTAPYGWEGQHKTLQEHVATTFKRLRGRGLEQAKLDALIGYIESLEGPRRRAASEIDAVVMRGRAIFSSVDAGCTNCHREEAALTDGALHDVSSSALADRTSVFETPSLRFVGGTAPYFHDGRYATLLELLYATRKTMGSTTHLGAEDMAALEAYLMSL